MPKQDSRMGKMGKSSKTARVLNLLTDPGSIESPAKSDPSQAAGGDAMLTDDRKAQANIRNALEDALEMELSEAAGASAAPTAPAASVASVAPARPPKRPKAPSSRQSVPEIDQPSAQEDDTGAEDPAATPNGFPASEPFFSVPTPADKPLENTLNELRAAGEEKPDEFICFNVMQALVEDKADKYIRMFGLCNCNRCHIDVVALALSNLPAKYVVAKPHELIPRLSMYEQKYSVAVVTQVMSACRKVLDRPHHQRRQG